jgi:uncharacterized protein (UPF0303 family)
MSAIPTVEELERQEAMLVFKRFDEDTAWTIGAALVAVARGQNAPVVVDIRTPDRTLFHAALPGAIPDNDHWARRKSNVVLRLHQASMRASVQLGASGERSESAIRLDPADYAAHGGSFPIRVAGVGVIGAVTVSGLASEDDHAMIVRVLEAHLKSAEA